ncbi:MAG: hypothetical protein M1830_005638 [Pleopsidium flavum]|nr:MAG: hypothetical protein M1830_005638 [Pleopsidium flavum]
MSFVPLNPRPMLQSLVNEDVIVHLKWGQTEYKGRLISVDSYMNIQLSNTEEFIDNKSTGSLGQVLIRCKGKARGYRDGWMKMDATMLSSKRLSIESARSVSSIWVYAYYDSQDYKSASRVGRDGANPGTKLGSLKLIHSVH